MHKAITHNLLFLLKACLYGLPDGDIMPMSQHKWRVLREVARQLNVLPYILPYLEREEATGADTFTRESIANDCPLRDEPEYDASEAYLFNHWTNKRLLNIREEEMNSHNISEDTLRLLDILVMNIDSIITRDVDVQGFMALGMHMQRHSSGIDYEKLRLWIRRLGIVQIASLEGNILVQALGALPDDVPFIHNKQNNAGQHFMRSIRRALQKHSFSTSTRLNVAMLETVSYRFYKAITMVTDIEE